jgi:hypothetical protein
VALTVVLGTQVVLGISAAAAATSFTVTTTADISVVAGACGNTAILTPPNPASLSLREATCLANNNGGTSTINVPAGTYTLTHGELDPGVNSGQNLTIDGASAASTIVTAGGASRVLDFDENVVGGVTASISGVTITGGADSTFGGAGIIAGDGGNGTTADSLGIANSIITDNHANGATPNVTNNPGGGVQFIGGTLSISNSTISSNSSASSPGSGVVYAATGTPSGESLTVSNTTFSANSATNTNGTSVTNGGALDLIGLPTTAFHVTDSQFVNNTVVATTGGAVGAGIRQESGALTVLRSTFTGNSATGGASAAVGGAIEVTTGTATLNDNRFTGNVAAAGSALHVGSGASAVDATENWFGCNGGPGAIGCNTVSGVASLSPRLVFAGDASPATINGPDATSTVTAGLTTDSLGAAVSPADLTAFTGLPVSWTDPQPGPATVSAPSASIAAGTASVTYNSQSSSGPGHVVAGFDNASLTVPITVEQVPAITTNPSDQTVPVGDTASFTAAASGFPVPTVQWQLSTDGGASFSNIAGATSATYSFTVAAADNGNEFRAVFSNTTDAPHSATTTAATLTVTQAPAFTSPATATFVTGSNGSFTITTSGVPPVTAVAKSGTLPAGLTFTDNGDGTATLAGTPDAGSGGTYPVGLAATNGISPDATQSLSVQVNQAPAVTTDPADQTVNPGTSVSFTAAATGVPTPTVQWQISTDDGASFANLAGATSTTLSFTAAAGEDGDQFRAVFTNLVSSATTTAATLRVGTAPAFTSSDVTTFAVGTAGSFDVTTSGIPDAAITATGVTPAWLTLTDNGDGTATLTGTPPTGSGGSYSFTLHATNGFSPAASQLFTLSVDESPAITSADHATFTVGSAGTFAVTTTAGFPTATAISKTGALPSGVTLVDNHDGTATLSGTPDAGTSGTYPITISAAATGGVTAATTQSFTLTVHGPPTITSADHTTFTAGTNGSFTVTTTAGNPAATTLSKTGALPSGVSFVDNGDGTATLAGTPDAGTGGSYPITIRASDGVSPDAMQSFTLTVNESPTITSADHATFVKGAPGTFTVATSLSDPNAIVLTASPSGNLPPGMSFTDNGDGTATLAGTPTGDGVFGFTITASNGVHPDATQSFTATVHGPPTITSADHATFTTGLIGTFTVTTTAGTPTATTLSKTGALPTGVSFVDNGDGTATLAGTPDAGTGGSYPIRITASNGVSPDATQSFTLTVDQAPAITSADHTTFTIGTAGGFTMTSTGFPVVALTETGALPGGVTFTDSGDGTATLAGTPAVGSNGSYPLTFTTTNTTDTDQQAFTLTVVKAPQAITVTSTPPTQAIVGAGYGLSATADSGLTVAYSIDGATTNSACSLSGSTVSFDHAGSCVIDFSQAGNGTFAAAPRVQQTLAVSTVATSVALVSAGSPTVVGQPASVTATVSAGGASPAGAVQFAVDGTDVGSPVAVSGGSAASPNLTDSTGHSLAPGAHTVTAVFTPDDTTTYAPATGSTTQVVNQAATTQTIAVTATTVVAHVTPVAPGAGTPTGSVTFTVGGKNVGNAPLTSGVATLEHVVKPGMTRQVASSYAGDVDFTGSSASTARSDPSITTKVTSRSAKTHFGWYRSPVRVTFHCVTHGAPLTAPCPAAVTLTHNGAGQSVTRTITATDGGTKTAVVRGINIDGTDPKVHVTGVHNGAVYDGTAPTGHCVAKDALSGVASCKISRHTSGTKTTYRAVAKDKAGNTATVSGSYRTLGITLQGVKFSHGAFTVKPGHTYTLVAHASSRPTYYDAAPYPTKPFKRDRGMLAAGHHRWALGITMSNLGSHRLWNLGVKIGHTMHVVRIRLS